MKRGRSALGAPAVLATAAAGTVAGHALTYRLAIPDAARRTAVLARSGHAYWPTAVTIAGAVAVVSVASFAIAAAMRHRSGHPSDRAATLALRLAAAQVAGFMTMEVLERLAVGASPLGVLSHRLVLVGIVVQVVLACAIASMLAWLGRAAARVEALAAGPADRLRRGAAVALDADRQPPVHRTTARTIRAPPAHALAVGGAR